MSHFVRCDRCDLEDAVIGTLSLPPGWQKICGADLCEPCCIMVRDFIRFKPGDAEKLPIEPIEQIECDSPVSDKLFETSLADVTPERGTGQTGCNSSVDASPEVEAGRVNPEINSTGFCASGFRWRRRP